MSVMEYICHLPHILASTDAHSFEFTSIEILILALHVQPKLQPGKWAVGILVYNLRTALDVSLLSRIDDISRI